MNHLRSPSRLSKCYTLSAFIFEAGIELQRNAFGLLRTLLWQLLKEDIDRDGSLFSLVDKVSPGSVDSIWTEGQLLSCLKAASSETQATFLLILDGLDESDDELWLLRTIKDLETMSNVKMCLSSRPEVVLTKALQHQPRLRLQDLIKSDILKVVEERLIIPLSLDSLTSGQLSNMMVRRAEDVFLWVDLVVRDLHAGYLRGASSEDLQRRLEDLPPGLFNLYTRMLERNNREMEVYRSEAERYLRMIYAAGPLNLLEVKIALEQSIQDCFLLPESTWDCTEVSMLDVNQLAVQIRARCAGLLEVRSTTSTDSHRFWLIGNEQRTMDKSTPPGSEMSSTVTRLNASSSETVQFIHRSVIDYLKSLDQGKLIIGSDLTTLQPERENANRSRLVSAIAFSNV